MAITEVNLGTLPDGVGGDTPRSAMVKINQNFTDNSHAASRLVGTATGNVMEVGAFGIGTAGRYAMANPAYAAPATDLDRTQMYGFNDTGSVDYGKGLGWSVGNKVHFIIGGLFNGQLYHVVVADKSAETRTIGYHKIRTEQNTSVDPNGFIKNASPIVSLYADKIELNDEAKEQVNITFEKLDVGDYLIKGSTGFAQEGWYIETPKDANGNVLVAVVYEQLKNNDIRVKTYSKMVDKITGDVVPNTKEPKDIPPTRWIDIRLNKLPDITA